MSKEAIDQREMRLLEDVLASDVSRETFEALDIYRKALIKWNSSINLVSPGTIEGVWERHFVDSAQLYRLLPDDSRVVFDFGSGAGFPGMVLAVLLKVRAQVYLCESDQRKCLFLKNVSRETNTATHVINKRIEAIDPEETPVPDVITARALASLERLLAFSLPWAEANPDLVLLFLKGQNAEQEIEEAQKRYSFDVEILPSRTSHAGRVLKIMNLKAKS